MKQNEINNTRHDFLILNLTGKNISIHKLTTKSLYNFLVSNTSMNGPKSKDKYELDYGILDWKNINTLARKTTIEPRLREIQYKIIHRYLPTNKLLKIYGIKETNYCTYCHINIETLEHLLWDCVRSKTLWVQFKEWWDEKINIPFPTLTCETVLFGSFLNLPGEIIYNHFLLLIKSYIFRNKETIFLFNNVLNTIKKTARMEKFIAENGNNLIKYLEKWGPYLNIKI